MVPARAALERMRRGRAAVKPERAAVPPALLSMAELLPIENNTLRIRPLHASARAAWSAWLRGGGEHALVRSSKGAFTKVRLVVGARARSGPRIKRGGSIGGSAGWSGGQSGGQSGGRGSR